MARHFFCRGLKGQYQAEARARAWCAADFDMAAVALGHDLDQGEPQTRAALLPGGLQLNPVKAVEQLWQLLLGNAYALIRNAATQLVIFDR